MGAPKQRGTTVSRGIRSWEEGGQEKYNEPGMRITEKGFLRVHGGGWHGGGENTDNGGWVGLILVNLQKNTGRVPCDPGAENFGMICV